MPSVSTDPTISDNMELALVLKPGQFCTEPLSEVLNEIFKRRNIVVLFSHQHNIARATSEPSEAFLEHCKRIIERKFAEPNFGGMAASDLNESYEDPDLVFITHNFAFPAFINTDDIEPPSNEVHLFILEVVTYRDKDDLEETDVLATITDFFIKQGYDKDNTWVGIDEYADIDSSYLLPQGSAPANDNEEQFSATRSTVLFKDHSSWTSIQRFMSEALHGFTYAIAFRMYEMIGVRDPNTNKITFTRPDKIHLGVPTRKSNT